VKVLDRACRQLPDRAATYYDADDALLLACFAGQAPPTRSTDLPTTLTFARLWQLSQAPAGIVHNLPEAVYAIDSSKVGTFATCASSRHGFLCKSFLPVLTRRLLRLFITAMLVHTVCSRAPAESSCLAG
jgi:hypothetical protein